VNQFIKNLNDVKAKIRARWSRLTERDIDETHGETEHLRARIKEAYGCNEAQVNREFNDFASRNHLKFEERNEHNSDTFFHPENPIVSPATPIIPRDSKIIQ
jgi:uncharacterized protein YjbJ (UPF0337 family)